MTHQAQTAAQSRRRTRKSPPPHSDLTTHLGLAVAQFFSQPVLSASSSWRASAAPRRQRRVARGGLVEEVTPTSAGTPTSEGAATSEDVAGASGPTAPGTVAGVVVRDEAVGRLRAVVGGRGG